MSKITITFDDLCAFFTKKLADKQPQLMVGLIENQTTDPQDKHEPLILITENETKTQQSYRGFKQVYGQIFLNIYDAMGKLISPTIKEKSQPDAGQYPFNKIPDLENHLYQGKQLTVLANSCKARLYFQQGELYTRGPINTFDFCEEHGGIRRELRLLDVPDKAVLEVTVPAGGYATLHFDAAKKEFKFDAGKSYEVEITNVPPSGGKDSRHFLHFYEIVQGMTQPRLFPVRPSNPGNLSRLVAMT